MVAPKDFGLVSCQASLFTPDEEVSGAKLGKGLLPSWTERFDAEPIILPSAQGLPRAVPRLIVQSQSGQWRCEIASARINFFWRRAAPEVAEPTLPEFFTDAQRFLHEYVAYQGARVGRVAAVLNRYVRHDSPASFLTQHFCQERWVTSLADVQSFELHIHRRFDLGTFSTNCWVRNKTGTISEQGEPKPIILVEQDINTLAEDIDDKEFSENEVKEFFSAVAGEFDELLRLYYPGE